MVRLHFVRSVQLKDTRETIVNELRRQRRTYQVQLIQLTATRFHRPNKINKTRGEKELLQKR